ncbi:MAG: hypothetical protein JW891_02900 [Candidatus Lokiarchaeota archaeon]|nr:hypothetical protein [Candidatus Lokiarchaeota archaeon]
MRENGTQYPYFLFMGHISIDTIIKNGITHPSTLGGSVSFGSIGLKTYSRDVKIRIISKCGSNNLKKHLLEQINKQQIDLSGVQWKEMDNTHFILEYYDHARSLILKSKSPNLEFKDIPIDIIKNPPDIIVLAPICSEISIEFISSVLEHFPNALIGMDLQGFVREISENGSVSYTKNIKNLENLKNIVIKCGERLVLKGSEEEMKLVAGGSEDLSKIMSEFDKFDLKGIYIMTLGEAGSMLIRHGCDLLYIPAYRSDGVKDETGAGDIYLSVFLYEYFLSNKSWNSVKKAASLASASASFLVEKIGPKGFKSRKKIIKRVKRANYIQIGEGKFT